MPSQTSNRFLGLSTVFIALFLHLGFLWMIDGMEVHVSTVAHPRILQAVYDSGPEDPAERKALERKRNQELAEVFSEVLFEQEISAPEETAILADALRENESLGIESEEVSLEVVPPSLEEALASEAIEASELQAENFLSAPEMIAILDPNTGSAQGKLLQATEAMRGEMLVESLENLTEEGGVQVGSPESASLSGASLEYRSGVVNQGEVEGEDGGSALSMVMDSSKAPMPEQELEITPIAMGAQSAGGGASSLLREALSGGSGGGAEGKEGKIASSDDFTVDVTYTRLDDKKGFAFCIRLLPKEGVIFQRIKKNVYFLLDRSHSVDHHRYEEMRAAVSKALIHLHPEDTFNILVFDRRVSRFADQNVDFSSRNVTRARAFLDGQEHGGFFATTNLYSSLGKIIPKASDEVEINTAILLSDGDTFLSPQKQRKTLATWTQANDGQVTLYSVATGGDNNLPLLDVLSVYNRGYLAYSPDHSDTGELLANLLSGTRNPIAKNIVATVVSRDPNNKVKLFPSSQRLPDLFEGTTYTIYGHCAYLEDFTLFLQGKYYDRWLDIKQSVSFANAKPAWGNTREDLLAKMARHEAFLLYDRFLEDGGIRHLKAAKRLLSPFNLQTAFQ